MKRATDRCGRLAAHLTLGRVWWTSLALLHAPIFARVSAALLTGEADAGRMASWGALLLTLAFFALKAIDVPWLRLGSRRASAVAFLVVCGLVHGHATGRALIEKAVPEAALAAPIVMAAAAIRFRKRLLTLLDGVLRRGHAALLRSLVRVAAVAWRLSEDEALIARSHGPPRAPPAIA